MREGVVELVVGRANEEMKCRCRGTAAEEGSVEAAN